PAIFVDLRSSFEELLPAVVELSVVIQIVNIYFEASSSKARTKSLRFAVALFWNDLERRLDATRVVEIHELVAEVPASLALHIVRHDRAALRAIGPEPDERNFPDTKALQFDSHRTLHQGVDRKVHWPARERNLLPSA